MRVALLVSLAPPAWPQDKSKDLTNKSLEDLMNMEVTSASKKEQKISHTAAPIFVITQDDIQRSGATNIRNRKLSVARSLSLLPAKTRRWRCATTAGNS